VSEILLNNGEYFDFINPGESKFDIYVIASALSKLCRFNGQCEPFYSVAQHSVLVSHIVPKELAFQGLMHDAHEAFVGDMTTMLKRLIPEYKVFEDIAAAEVRKRFGIPFDLHEDVHNADMINLMTERHQLLPPRDDDHIRWARVIKYKALDCILQPMLPDDAKTLFLTRYKELVYE